MKRIASIITILFISLMVIWLGAGVTLLHCAHSNETEIVQLHNIEHGDCCHEIETCCSKTASCMGVHVLKLAPVVQSHIKAFDFSHFNLFTSTCLHPFVMTTYWLGAFAKPWLTPSWWSPPRDYLALIRILRI